MGPSLSHGTHRRRGAYRVPQMAEPVVLREVTDHVGVITMNRPDRRNALNGELAATLDAAVKDMAADDAVKVVVLTGAAPAGGTGGFCSGGDTKSDAGDRRGLELGVPTGALAGDLARHDTQA